jgi:LCP family protein required for cell wall assembly
MANGRPPGDGSSRSSRRHRRQLANSDGLAALGSQMRGGAPSGAVANQAGLQALGARIDEAAGRGRRRRSGKPRWSRRRKVVTLLTSFVVFIALVAAGGYGYFRYGFKFDTAPCPHCTQVAEGVPYNVLVIGSDTRVGETAAEAKEFGNQTDAGGQRSDTIKIIHVDPQSGTASILSIPRDTFVSLSGVPASSGVSTMNKINAAFATGPNDPNPSGTGANGVLTTIQDTFGIPISHWIVVNFFGLMDAVNALDGVSMDVPFPVRDYGDCNGNGIDENCTGLDIPTPGCQVLSGTEALALSRSRHFEWYQDGEWQSDLSGDIGRIERQDLLIEAVVNKAKSTYNPIRAFTFITSLKHDVTVDNALSNSALLSLAERYHAFSGSSLKTYTLPTTNGYYAPYSEDVELVQEPAATEVITQFLGGAPTASSTPPLDQNGDPVSTAAPAGTVTTLGSSAGAGTATSAPTGGGSAAPTSAVAAYDPRPC